MDHQLVVCQKIALRSRTRVQFRVLSGMLRALGTEKVKSITCHFQVKDQMWRIGRLVRAPLEMCADYSLKEPELTVSSCSLAQQSTR